VLCWGLAYCIFFVEEELQNGSGDLCASSEVEFLVSLGASVSCISFAPRFVTFGARS
jgi:hypothetical protein